MCGNRSVTSIPDFPRGFEAHCEGRNFLPFSPSGSGFGLGIERIDVRHSAAQVDEDDALGCTWKMRRLGRQWIFRAGRGVLRQQLAQQRRKQAGAEKQRSYASAAE